MTHRILKNKTYRTAVIPNVLISIVFKTNPLCLILVLEHWIWKFNRKTTKISLLCLFAKFWKPDNKNWLTSSQKERFAVVVNRRQRGAILHSTISEIRYLFKTEFFCSLWKIVNKIFSRKEMMQYIPFRQDTSRWDCGLKH